MEKTMPTQEDWDADEAMKNSVEELLLMSPSSFTPHPHKVDQKDKT